MGKIGAVHKLSRTEFEIVEIDEETDVLYVCVMDGLLHYQTETGLYKQITTLEEQLKYLEKLGYIKTERGYLVNMAKAEAYKEETQQITFRSGHKAPVSKPFRKEVTDRLPTINKERGQHSFNMISSSPTNR